MRPGLRPIHLCMCVQSFDSDVLKKLSKKTCIPLVQLVQPG